MRGAQLASRKLAACGERAAPSAHARLKSDRRLERRAVLREEEDVEHGDLLAVAAAAAAAVAVAAAASRRQRARQHVQHVAHARLAGL